VVLLHDWTLHHLVLSETVERGDTPAYLREMRRAHGEAGAFIARQVARGLGGDLWPALYPLNGRMIEASLGIIALTPGVAARARLLVPHRPVMALPHHLSLPLDPLPTRAEARRALGLPEAALVVTTPGLATRSKQLDLAVEAVARLRARHPHLHLVVAGAVEKDLPLESWARRSGLGSGLTVTGRLSLEDFTRHLVAADVVLALRFPDRGEMSGSLVRALGVGRPVLVTAGTPAVGAFPEGIVVPVDPGPGHAAGLEALLSRLLEDAGLRESIGRMARVHMLARHDLTNTTRDLARFLEDVFHDLDRLKRAVASACPDEGSLDAYLLDEVRAATHELGLGALSLDIEPLLAPFSRPIGLRGADR
jgi:glycosyltransferase involved in cell wall biosynthesis